MFSSDESGRDEIYIQPFPGPGPRRQVTVDGGTQPVWRGDGRELFYVRGRSIYALTVGAPGTFVGKPALLFQGQYFTGARGIADYDATPDGLRFVMVKPSEEELVPPRLNIVLNWFDEVARRVPQGGR